MSTVFPSLATPAVERNVEYARPDGTPLFLDASFPDGPGPFPAAILVHGGGWVRGDRRVDIQPLLSPLEQANIAWFSIDYRLTSDWTQFGVAVEDVTSALRFVRSQAKRFHIDPNRIALIGESAGGQLASMAALQGVGESPVQAVVALYTPSDLVQLAQQSEMVPQQIRAALKGSPLESLLLARLRQLSPVDNVRPGAPPFLLIHGTADSLVPFSQSQALQSRLQAAGVPCELYPVKGGGHGIRWWESARPAEAAGYKREMVHWLERALGVNPVS